MRNKRTWLTVLAIALVAFLVYACGGGGGDTSVAQDGTGSGNENTGNQIQPPAQDPDLPPHHDQTPPEEDPLPPQPDEPVSPDFDDLPPSVVRIPKDNRGVGRITVRDFDPEDRLLMATINVNPAFLDFAPQSVAGHPLSLPEYNYFISASVSEPRSSSSSGSTEGETSSRVDRATGTEEFAEPGTAEHSGPDSDGDRELSQAQSGPIPLDPPAPSLDLGEVRVFSRLCRTSLPPLPRDDDDEIQGGIPNIYFWQRGRLAAIGKHSYIFLSTEINNGYPEERFTQERLNRLAETFDQKIIRESFNKLVPKRFQDDFSFAEQNVFFPPDSPVTGLQFDDEGNVTNVNPDQLQQVDSNIQNDQRFIIMIYNQKDGVPPGAGAAAFFQPGAAQWTPQQCGIPIGGEEAEQDVPSNTNNFSGITVYLSNQTNTFPGNSDDWSNPEAVLAHEFQHVLNEFYGTTDTRWMNEGMSNLNMWLNGYTISSGSSDVLLGQINSWLAEPDFVPAIGDEGQGPEFGSYGARFALMQYISEHYPPGTIIDLYRNGFSDPTLAADPIANIERATGEDFESIFTKFALTTALDTMPIKQEDCQVIGDGVAGGEGIDCTIANFTDFKGSPWLTYQNLDLNGNFGTTTRGLNGPRIDELPSNPELYPLDALRRDLKPWTMDYTVLTNGEGGELNLEITSSDPNTQHFLLPLHRTTDANGEQAFVLTDEVQVD